MDKKPINKGIKLDYPEKLDEWLLKHKDDCFPSFDSQLDQKSYPERYEDFARVLLSVHSNIEIGAMIAGAVKWVEETKKIAEEKDDEERQQLLKELQEADPIVHLNNHGKGHINKVIQKASEILYFFERGHLTPYEGFFLLCAIQLHDTGNIFGRKKHEEKCTEILDSKSKNIINDSFERNLIKKLAMVHGGTFNGDRDTIGKLAPKKKLYDGKIRKTLLAALLRFADELADDHSRADIEGLEQETIIEGGVIYHRYSEALHTVQLEQNPENDSIELNLCYEFNSSIASQTFKKRDNKIYLLDEIYERTLKMERERRYCMRYLRPYFSLDRIKVEIVIQNVQNAILNDKISYTLEENGYPRDPETGTIKKFGNEIRTGEEELKYMKEKWGIADE